MRSDHLLSIQHGDLFTFILIGRKVTVALGPKVRRLRLFECLFCSEYSLAFSLFQGNDMILGGKLSQVSAEEAYTVRPFYAFNPARLHPLKLPFFFVVFKHLTTPVFGKDVVYDCPNHVLMEQKKFVKFGLSLDNLKAYIPMIFEEFNLMVKTDASFAALQSPARSWGSFPALKTLGELTILTASRTLQGKEVRASLDKTFAKKYEDLDRGFTPINFLFPYLPLPSYWKRDKAQKEMSDFYLGIIEGRRNGESDVRMGLVQAVG